MCIIAHSPAGVELPDDDEIKHMFQKNPHGAGFAIQDNGKVTYRKGFMTVEEFIEALGDKSKLKDKTVVMHFRIKTHGNTDKFTTHPFKLSSNYGDLRKLEGEGPVLFHNGTFTGLGGVLDKNSSDTQDFVSGVANKLLTRATKYKGVNKAVVDQIVSSNRVLILYEDKKHPILKLGTWYEHKGNYYSNTGFKGYYTSAGFGMTTYSHADSYKGSLSTYRLDLWGANVAEYATPDTTGWIICKTKERFNELLRRAVSRMETDKGEIVYTYYATGAKQWHADEDNLWLYTNERLDDVEDRKNELKDIYAELQKDGYIAFLDEDEMLDWISTGTQISPYEVVIDGETWYIDDIDLEAYTSEGLSKIYGVKESKKIKKEIEEQGYYLEGM